MQNAPIQSILTSPITLDIKRLDLIDPFISGNKFFKLKYNLSYAKEKQYQGVISFGGAYSNHIHALSYACRYYQLECLAIIRGDELSHQPLNSTLTDVARNGTQIKFISREQYRQRHHPDFLAQLQQAYPNYYIIPEGGSNELAIQGCQEIISTADLANYDWICCAVGTGSTLAGIIQKTAHSHTQVLGFSALKDHYLSEQIRLFINDNRLQHWQMNYDYCCGGYAKTTPELIQFIHHFEQNYHIPIEPIYTGKMLYGIFDLIQNDFFTANSRILAIHTGGLQAKMSLM